MDYSQTGVLATQARVQERLQALLVEQDMRLDPGSPVWFDGSMDLPKPGEPWKMTLARHGARTSIEFRPTELDSFLSGQPNEVVSRRLRRAVEALQRPKPQERGLA